MCFTVIMKSFSINSLYSWYIISPDFDNSEYPKDCSCSYKVAWHVLPQKDPLYLRQPANRDS